MYTGENYFPKSIYGAFTRMEQRLLSATFYGDLEPGPEKGRRKAFPRTF